MTLSEKRTRIRVLALEALRQAGKSSIDQSDPATPDDAKPHITFRLQIQMNRALAFGEALAILDTPSTKAAPEKH